MPGQRGRKPLSPLGKRRQVTLTISPEEAVFLSENYGSPGKGLKALVKQAMAGPLEKIAEAQQEAMEQLGYPRTAQALKPKVPKARNPSTDDMCERCRRIGMPSCDACRKKMGQS